MNFTERMALGIGRNIEVYQETQFISGVLVDVTPVTLVVQAVENVYTQTSGLIGVVSANVDYVRFLP